MKPFIRKQLIINVFIGYHDNLSLKTFPGPLRITAVGYTRDIATHCTVCSNSILYTKLS